MRLFDIETQDICFVVVDNKIGDYGAQALGHALEMNSTLLCLYLAGLLLIIW